MKGRRMRCGVCLREGGMSGSCGGAIRRDVNIRRSTGLDVGAVAAQR